MSGRVAALPPTRGSHGISPDSAPTPPSSRKCSSSSFSSSSSVSIHPRSPAGDGVEPFSCVAGGSNWENHQGGMESYTDASSPPSAAAAAAAADEPLRVKFLCSFGGSILPRPLDGKLRYVGGETRIVSVPRDVSFEELMARMRELFEGAWALKYQQPDEDLDSLVSVVNDDDVTNMMEEYDKLAPGGGGDGFTRLRIFLFSHPDLDGGTSVAGAHFDSSDERETERRYVDALNSLTDGKPQLPDASMDGSRINAATDQFFSGQFNLHHLTIPHQHSHGQRYTEMEGPRSPAYYSPGHHTTHDPREFPPSPSSGRFHPGFGDLSDRVPEEYVRQSPALQPPLYEHHPPFAENVVWLPPGGVIAEKAGFPGNLGHTHNVYEGSTICEHCRMAFQRIQPVVPEPRFHDPHWKHVQPHLEQLSIGNEFAAQYSNNSCAECFRSRATNLSNQDIRLDHVKEQSEHCPFYDELHSHDRGRILHLHQLNHHPEESRGHRKEQFIIDSNGMSFPLARGRFNEGRPVPHNCISSDDPRYVRPASELANTEVYHDQQTVGAGIHMRIPVLEDSGICYGNNATYGADNLYPVAPGSSSICTLRRNVQGTVHPGPSYEAPGLVLQANGAVNMGMIRTMQDGSPRISCIAVDGQWAGHGGNVSQKVFPIDVPMGPEYYYDHALKSNMNVTSHENRHSFVPESVQCQPSTRDYGIPEEALPMAPPSSGKADDKMVASLPALHHPSARVGTDLTSVIGAVDKISCSGEAHETSQAEMVKDHNACKTLSPKEKQDTDFDPNGQRPIGKDDNTSKLFNPDASGPYEKREVSVECLNFLPELIDSVKKAVLEGAEEVKARVQASADVNASPDLGNKELSMQNTGLANSPEELDADSDTELQAASKIEPTMAEAEALSKGLQTIKNDDLEEIRELGSGTYGAVYHGKWKGSDVAIKRIKESCFSGKPSERERLIADFWKEALILSSLHHPNVVSFYGIVRDGPDGTLATVTEFMVNGSLKQFLQKKDRTIDRRKRLIIAMDAAFGMEYLHGKNIVHFDLKCENLLVNMRDPHRPVCKIGDLGLSKVKQKTLVSGGIRGTLPWMAPELLSGKSNMVTEKIDVYSFGIVMWELLTGEEPYADMHCASIIGGIVNNALRPQIPTWCDPEWKSLMESCWSSDPGGRPSFSDISQKLRKMSAAVNVK